MKGEPLFDADLAIVGAGPAGLTLANEFKGSRFRIVILESGVREETPAFAELNRLHASGELSAAPQIRRRTEFHGRSAASWSHEQQPYGVRSRGFGGSSLVWAGKSAPFDPIDFERRAWVPNSGWPIAYRELQPHLDRALEALNFGPNYNNSELWPLLGRAPEHVFRDPQMLRDFFWQFARSRVDRMDVLRFAREFVDGEADNITVLLNATVTEIDLSADGAAFAGLEISTLCGKRGRVRAAFATLAAGAIENARLLLASQRRTPAGVGNRHDCVGRYLMDHPGATIGAFARDDLKLISEHFGFYGLSRKGRSHMYLRGLALSEQAQRAEHLLNCALYIMEERAPDDPWEALKRLIQRNSAAVLTDLRAVVSSPGLLIKGLGTKALASALTPELLKDLIVNAVVAYNPNFAVREFRDRGLPHKLTGLTIEAITEQQPDRANRVTLAPDRDSLGVPRAQVIWTVGDAERRSLARLGRLMVDGFRQAGLPAPRLEPWILADRLEEAVIIDMCHSAGTTRMSVDPTQGVVDPDSRIHGVRGLYVAGSSVFPTSGHANPTLMIAAMAIRLADHLKRELRQNAAA